MCQAKYIDRAYPSTLKESPPPHPHPTPGPLGIRLSHLTCISCLGVCECKTLEVSLISTPQKCSKTSHNYIAFYLFLFKLISYYITLNYIILYYAVGTRSRLYTALSLTFNWQTTTVGWVGHCPMAVCKMFRREIVFPYVLCIIMCSCFPGRSQNTGRNWWVCLQHA